jgi:hypothetical protein
MISQTTEAGKRNMEVFPLLLAIYLVLTLFAGASAATPMADSSLDDQADGAKTKASVPSNRSEPTIAVVEVTIPLAPGTPEASASERPLSANPLWAMPLKQFTITRERPLFLPSRRPPTPPPSPVTVAKVVVPKPKEPEQPQLSLVGTIASDEDKFGIFVDQSSKAVLRLRVGEDFQGWKLRSVNGREVILERDQLTSALSLPEPGVGVPEPRDETKIVQKPRELRPERELHR